jgi:phosphoserine phosphatase RsbU/P
MSKIEKISVSQSYLKRLKRKVEALRVLTETSPVISSTLDLQELMTIVMEKAKGVMNAEACSILLYNRETKKLEFEVALGGEDSTSALLKKKITLNIGQGIAGWVARNKKLLVIKDVKNDKRFFQEADKVTGFVTKSIIAVPLIGRRGLIGVAEIINPGKKEYDLEILQILSTHFAIAIENAFYHRESIEKERLKQELEIAASLQKSFLPEVPTFSKRRVTVSGVNIPAKQVGGDLYDIIEPVEGAIGVFIGDVSGKGVSAALYMAKIISDFRYSALTIGTPEIVMNRLNSVLSKAPRGMFLTAAYMIIDSDTGDLQVSVAGHPPFLWVAKKNVQAVSVPSGPPLGIIPGEYSSSRLSLQKGDKLVLLTDGVFDAKNREGQRIGFDAIVNLVQKHAGDKRLIDVITGYVQTFSKGAETADDLTIVEITVS